jgi:hypothetical protein
MSFLTTVVFPNIKICIATVASILHWSRVHRYMFRIALNKLFERLFSRVLASHRGGPGSIPGRDM